MPASMSMPSSFYATSMSDHHMLSSSLAQVPHKELAEASDGPACKVRVQATATGAVRSPRSMVDYP